MSMFYSTTLPCPKCGKVYDVEWPKDDNFICECGNAGYWSHYDTDPSELIFFWEGEEE